MTDNNQSRVERRKNKKGKKKPAWKKWLLVIGIFILLCVVSVGGLFTYYISTAPEIDASKLKDAFSSEFFDSNKHLFADLGTEQRTKITYDDLPQQLIDAVIATEDSRFFEHPGIDVLRIGKAVIANFKHGFGSQGASTITQQLVEKSFLSPEKKIKLKVQEMWLALKLEKQYSKQEILEMYLNKIYYGHRAYGVAKAAETYFGVTNLDDLTLPEAAILAGLPQRPSAYDPFKNPKLTKGRMNTVLDLMVLHHKISKDAADEARKVDISSLLVSKQEDKTPYHAFMDEVEKEVKQKLDGANIYTDGLKIYTTLDTDVQDYVDFLMIDRDKSPIPYPKKQKNGKGEMVDLKAGMAVLDTESGAIRALGGKNGNDGLNYAIDIKRQSGSTMKPILAYGPAIEYNKWSTYHQVDDDKPYKIPGSDNTIHNWNNRNQGWMSIRYALKQSLNIPAIKTLNKTGISKAQEFGEKLGVKFKDDKMSLTDAIGGAGASMSPLRLAGAYRAFGDGGLYNKPFAVTKVVYPDGHSVDLTPKPKSVMHDYTAYMVSDMMKSVVTSGTGHNANIPGLPVAGKTGTTNRPGVHGSPDAWFGGFTTNYTIAAWTGYNDNDLANPNTQIPLYLFKHTMSHISKGKETKDFEKPDSVVRASIEKGSKPARKPSKYTPDSKIVTELFVKGTTPSKQSAKYDKPDAVKDLKATLDKDAIDVTWNYGDDDDTTFKVSASVDNGDMKELSTTKKKKMTIDKVKPNTSYKIQVIAVKDDMNSDPRTVQVNGPTKKLGAVSNLTAQASENAVHISWHYDGPKAKFKIVLKENNKEIKQQITTSTNQTFSNLEAGHQYKIEATPIGLTDALKDIEGNTASKYVTILDKKVEEDNQNRQDNDDVKQNQQNNDDGNQHTNGEGNHSNINNNNNEDNEKKKDNQDGNDTKKASESQETSNNSN